MRIFLGLEEIAGFFGQLRAGLEECGHEAVFVNLVESPFRYGGDAPPNLLTRVARRTLATVGKGHAATRYGARAAMPGLRAALLAWAISRFDVFILHGASTFFRYHELRLLKALGKKIVYVYLGSDERPPYLNGVFISRGMSTSQMRALTRQIKTSIMRVERHADLVVGHPMSGQFHEKPFLQVMHLRLPYQGPDGEPAPGRSDGAVRIVHAPSRGSFIKGTPTIRAAIEVVKRRHVIDFVELSGRPNAEVQAALRGADFVIDELYSDVLMAGFATEAAWFGKPAIVGGYENDHFESLLPPARIPPVYRIDPDGLVPAIERLITDVDFRLDLGRRARAFVHGLSRSKVAQALIDALEGRAPPEAFFDPRNAKYVHGCAVPSDVLRASLRDLIRAEGPGALLMDDKPALLERLLELATGV